MAENYEEFDYIIIGAGIEGSATAYSLSSKGYKTLLLEQFKLPHSNGSSHGNSRVTRKAYNEDIYAKMMKEAYSLWGKLAEESGDKLFENCGVLFVGPKKYQFTSNYGKVMDQNKFRHKILNANQIRQNVGTLPTVPDHWEGLFDPEGGVLAADKCLFAFQTLFARNGGVLRDNEKVLRVLPYASRVTIETDKNRYQCKSVVLCLGAWSGKFLKDQLNCNLPLEVEEITVCYWQEKIPEKYSAVKGTPVILLFEDEGEAFFLLPSLEYRGLVKVGYDFGTHVNPDNRKHEGVNEAVTKIKSCIRKFFPDLSDEPIIIQKCLYTHTPDRHFILDRHPAYKNVIIGAGFSGHGFKLAPVVGNILSNMALEVTQSHDYDLKELSIARFATFKPKVSAVGITHHLL